MRDDKTNRSSRIETRLPPPVQLPTKIVILGNEDVKRLQVESPVPTKYRAFKSKLVPILDYVPTLKPLVASTSWILTKESHRFVPFQNAVKFDTRYKLLSSTDDHMFVLMENVSAASNFLHGAHRPYSVFVFNEQGDPVASIERFRDKCTCKLGIVRHESRHVMVKPETLPLDSHFKKCQGAVVRLPSGEVIGQVIPLQRFCGSSTRKLYVLDAYEDPVMIIKRRVCCGMFSRKQFDIYFGHIGGGQLGIIDRIKVNGRYEFHLEFLQEVRPINKLLLVGALFHLTLLFLDRRPLCTFFNTVCLLLCLGTTALVAWLGYTHSQDLNLETMERLARNVIPEEYLPKPR